MPNTDIELVVDAKNAIGESPLWSKDEGALYWIDVKAPAIFRKEMSRSTAAESPTKSWHLPSEVGGYALKEDCAGAILALRSGIFDLDFAGGETTKLLDPPFEGLTHRFNEGDCDPTGRLWLGTMFDPEPNVADKKTEGHLFSFTLAGGLVKQNDKALLHNGFAWSEDGTEFFFAHSYERRIYRCAFDPASGTIGAKTVFAEIPREFGIPDGGAIDEDGCYWSAMHGGGRLHRYRPDGRLDRAVELPFKHPTMMAFAGPGLRDLYITSATHDKPGSPHEGGLFRINPGVAGLPRTARVR